MNFLSHFYFDRTNTNCFHILGTVMPDLLKNADKTIILHPEKLSYTDPDISSLIGGWQKHLEVDRYFHSSDFFKHHSHQLKTELLPALEGSPVKPFFLGHIAVELILDNLLLTTNKVTVEDFYHHLDNCNDKVISEFLLFCGMERPEVFLNFFANFKKHRYLSTYANSSQVAYALKRICMRIWTAPFTPQQEMLLAAIILDYRARLEPVFMQIFDKISFNLAS